MKPTTDMLRETLNSPICDVAESDLKTVFELFGFTLKEVTRSAVAASSYRDDVRYDFEVHYKDKMVVRVEVDSERPTFVTFENLYRPMSRRNGEEEFTISTTVKSIAELMIIINQFFISNPIFWPWDYMLKPNRDFDFFEFNNEQEMIDAVDFCVSVISPEDAATAN